MSSTKTLLREFLRQFYDLDTVSTRILSGHERLVLESRDGGFMRATFAGDDNPNWNWFAAMSGGDPEWQFSPGSSWVFGRSKELKNYRHLLSDSSSGLLGVWSSPKHLPSLNSTVEVWEKGAIKSDLLQWQQELDDGCKVGSLINNLSLTSPEENLVVFRGYTDVCQIGTSNIVKKMGRHDSVRNCEGLFRLEKLWRLWDANLLVQAVDSTSLLINETTRESVVTALNYRWGEIPDEVVTDSKTLKELFPSWNYMSEINQNDTTPCVYLADRLRAEQQNYDTLKPMLLFFQPLGGISSKKLLSSLKVKRAMVDDDEEILLEERSINSKSSSSA